jgi:hypothetical protein
MTKTWNGPATIKGDITFDNTPTVKEIQLDTTVSTPSHSEGLVFWDDVNKTVAWFDDVTGTIVQGNQENIFRGKNDTGAQINNGQIVYLSGHDGTDPLIKLAQANSATTSLGTIAVATHDIAIGAVGKCTRLGTVNDLNTIGCSPGDILYLSAVTAGTYTTTPPGSPNYLVSIGTCSKTHATEGSIEASINVGTNTASVIGIFNGATLEDTDLNVTSNGSTVTLSYEKNGGGDLHIFFDSQFETFDTTPAATVVLTPGSDAVPTLNYVYVPKSTNTLTANTTGWPTTEQFNPVATVFLRSAATTQTDGALKVHAWTDHLSNTVGQGHLSHVNAWIRSRNSTWISGTAGTVNITSNVGVPDNVDLSVTAGSIFQLHPHAFPAFDTATGSDIHIVNNFASPYVTVADLNTQLTDALGNSMSGNYFNLVFWGVVSQKAADSHIMCNLPTGSYTIQTSAENDTNGYTVFDVPQDFVGTAFLIGKALLKHSIASGGTWTLTQYTDLRGTAIGIGSSGATGIQTDFSDNQFTIFSVGDDTKVIDFDASTITTSTTRTITMPDKDVTLVDDADVVKKEDYDANTVLAATVDNTPITVTMLEQTVLGRRTAGDIEDIPIGVNDNDIVQIDSASVADDEYARFTANGLESRSIVEMQSDLNVEDGADVTDATNVNAAGATMTTDTDISSNGWFLDEDDMISDDNTKTSSQQAIKAYVDAEVATVESGVFYRRTVIDYVDCTQAPPTEVTGDRYILDDTGSVNAGWDGASQFDIVEFGGSTWAASTPSEGWRCYVDNENGDRRYIDDGTPAWEQVTGGTPAHNDTTGKQGGTTNEYYHTTSAEHTINTQAATASLNGYMTSTYAGKLDGIEALADVTNATNVNASGAVMETDYNDNTVLAATSDDTPVPLTVSEQTVVGRLTGGNITDVSLGIGDNNIVQIDGALVTNLDYAKFTTTGLQGRSYSEVRSDLGIAIQRYVFTMDDGRINSPVTSDWAVNAHAPAAQDSNNSALTVRLFNDTAEEGIGFDIYIPTGTTSLKFTFQSRPETAPGAARTVGLQFYERGLPGAVDTWSSGYALDDIDITTNENWLTDIQTETLITLGLTAGQEYQIELTRDTPTGGTNLTGDWALRRLIVECI